MTIRNVIFDMAGVLIKSSFPTSCARFIANDDDRALVTRELFHSVAWVKMDRGTMEPDEVERAVCKNLPSRLHAGVHEIMAHWHTQVTWIDGMEPLVRRVKKAGYGVYMLSNTAKSCHNIFDKLPAPDCFDGRLISADCQLLKPEPAIYHVLCDQFGLVPGECVFVDDAPANVEGALHVGMQGVVFYHDIERLVRELSELGVRL